MYIKPCTGIGYINLNFPPHECLQRSHRFIHKLLIVQGSLQSLQPDILLNNKQHFAVKPEK